MNIAEITDSLLDLWSRTSTAIRKHVPEWIAGLIPGYIQQIYEEARKTGYQAGVVLGTKEGHKKGFEEGKNFWVIEDHRVATTPQPIDSTIYGPQCFLLSEDMRDSMRAKVAGAVQKRLIDAPTAAQWEMIFAEKPSTCVIAGAGSGKSTTLILRIIFMLEHCSIPQHKITVVSFTKAACHELRLSLIEVLKHWRSVDLSYNEAKQLIRTFHSALYSVAQSTFGAVTFFENICNDKNKKKLDMDADVDDEDVDNSLSMSKLNAEQIDLLKDTYIDLFNTDSYFKISVLALMELSLLPPAYNSDLEEKYKSGTLSLASKRDLQLVTKVNQEIKKNGDWPSEDFQVGPIEAFTVYGHKFFANGMIKSSGQYVFFGGFSGEESFLNPDDVVTSGDGSNQFNIYAALKVKRKVIAQFADSKVFYINSKSALNCLNLWMRTNNKHSEASKAPIFDIQLNGEISAVPIYEAFFSQGSFIQSMGLDVAATVGKIRPFKSACLEYYFCSALSRFWIHFENLLAKKRIMTFNYAFLLLSNDGGKKSKPPSRAALECFTHLLIDEFQDISPQIVSWLLNCQRQLLNYGVANDLASIMAIGDDWQSIYGWRGSAPTFFTEFDRHFPVHSLIKTSQKIKMVENFRSIDAILRGAESLLQPISNKTEKSCVAVRPTELHDHGVVTRHYEKLNDEAYNEIVELILEQYEFTKKLEKSYKNRIMVMSRTNATLETLEKKIGNIPGIGFYTYHRAKGLQAEVAVMVEDCAYNKVHTLRNRIYECVPAFPKNYSYDEAQNDEAARLAYVGATRGIRRVVWFVPEASEGASKNLAVH